MKEDIFVRTSVMKHNYPNMRKASVLILFVFLSISSFGQNYKYHSLFIFSPVRTISLVMQFAIGFLLVASALAAPEDPHARRAHLKNRGILDALLNTSSCVSLSGFLSCRSTRRHAEIQDPLLTVFYSVLPCRRFSPTESHSLQASRTCSRFQAIGISMSSKRSQHAWFCRSPPKKSAPPSLCSALHTSRASALAALSLSVPEGKLLGPRDTEQVSSFVFVFLVSLSLTYGATATCQTPAQLTSREA